MNLIIIDPAAEKNPLDKCKQAHYNKEERHVGKKDVAAKNYLEINKYFADLFNVVVYHGQQVVSPDELEEADTTELSLPYGNNALEPVQKYRDLLKVSRRGKRAVYSLYGIEVQDQVHYAGPVKSALYDVLNLAKQVQMQPTRIGKWMRIRTKMRSFQWKMTRL